MANDPQFMNIPADDPEYRQTILDAQESLPLFRALLRLPGEGNALVCIKTRLTVGEASAFVWLMVIKPTVDGFVASVFEIPPEFVGVKVGDKIEVASGDVTDWMYNMGGLLHGGYSLRYQRTHLAPDQQAWFDEHIGVKQYAQLPGESGDLSE